MNCTKLRVEFLSSEAAPYIVALSGWIAALIIIFPLFAGSNTADDIAFSLVQITVSFIFGYCCWMFLTIVYLIDKYCFNLFLA